MKLKIISDGTREGTYIIPLGKGELENVMSIAWSIKEGQMNATATITVSDVQVEVQGEVNEPTVITCPNCQNRVETTVQEVGRHNEYKGTSVRWKCGKCCKLGYAEDWFFYEDMN